MLQYIEKKTLRVRLCNMVNKAADSAFTDLYYPHSRTGIYYMQNEKPGKHVPSYILYWKAFFSPYTYMHFNIKII
jgi:hypothetical protein